MVTRYIPEAGDIVWVDFSPTQGREQHGKRPAVVISVRAYTNASGLCTVCPVTSQVKGYTNEVQISTKQITGVVLSDQHKTIDIFARPLTKIGRVSPAALADIRDRICVIFGITG